MPTAVYEGWWVMNDDLIAFKGYVKRLGVFQDRQVPFVVFWVKRFLESGCPDEHSYSDSLAASGKQDWQIRQALDSVRLYRSFSGSFPDSPVESGKPVDVLVRQLRVRQYSTSTVKTTQSGAGSSWSIALPVIWILGRIPPLPVFCRFLR